jgi:hypothetical protein
MAQSNHIQSVYNSRKTMLEHLNYQSFNIEEYNNFSINEVYSMFQNKQLDMLVERNAIREKEIPKKKVYIKYQIKQIEI